MHYPDLSPYRYGPRYKCPAGCVNEINVGWLAGDEPFPTDKPSQVLLESLRRAAKKPVNKTRGYHFCDFCFTEILAVHGDEMDGVLLYQELEPLGACGNGEILIHGPDGECYHAPVMIVHYVEFHDYAPPSDFVDALLDTRRL